MKSFGQYLQEASEGIYDAMGHSIKQRIVSHAETNHPTVPLNMDNIRKHKIHDVLLSPAGIRGQMRHRSFRLHTAADLADDSVIEDYSFEIPPVVKHRFATPHKIQVNMARGRGSLMSNKPMTYDVSFTVDGQSGLPQIPSDAHEHHHAIYSGVMDAIAHHAIANKTDPDDYEFQAYAFSRDRKEKERMETAKDRRYGHILRSLQNMR